MLDLSFERLPSLEGALQGRHVSKLLLKGNLLTSLTGEAICTYGLIFIPL